MLIQGKSGINEKGQIIMHRHVDCIFQCIDFQQFRIIIMFSADRIEQIEQILPVTVEHGKNPRFVQSVYGLHLCCLVHINTSLNENSCRRLSNTASFSQISLLF